ncbi:MAG: sigma-70 family RNA polymerase sigma factor [Oscillospiraceae bacterium]|jgi:RNA polymerase sigma-70 factor (ECF subfamily)|nr:sigma-70 family RNA polymerase sigma factor [Oscillospiraceae bacterium]
MNDAKALWAISQGDAESLEKVIDKYSAYVAAVIRNKAGGVISRQDVEEIASDAFFALWQNAGKLFLPNIKAYLAGVARHKTVDKLRKMRQDLPLDELEDVISDDEPIGDMVEEQALADEVRCAITTLHEPYRETLTRRYRDGESVNGIAEEMGCSQNVVKQRLFRGRQMLKDAISDWLR